MRALLFRTKQFEHLRLRLASKLNGVPVVVETGCSVDSTTFFGAVKNVRPAYFQKFKVPALFQWFFFVAQPTTPQFV
jgi:hypothetical protein